MFSKKCLVTYYDARYNDVIRRDSEDDGIVYTTFFCRNPCADDKVVCWKRFHIEQINKITYERIVLYYERCKRRRCTYETRGTTTGDFLTLIGYCRARSRLRTYDYYAVLTTATKSEIF